MPQARLGRFPLKPRWRAVAASIATGLLAAAPAAAACLTDAEVANMNAVKAAGRDFFDLVASMPASREISLAKTKIEEAVMWAVKGITE